MLHRAEKVAARVFAGRRLAKRKLGFAPRKLEWLSKPKAAASQAPIGLILAAKVRLCLSKIWKDLN
jgi:hypothetical protein